ncbi:class I SAM-dependent methyltransferase [Colwelliaceae bacterium BS250]
MKIMKSLCTATILSATVLAASMTQAIAANQLEQAIAGEQRSDKNKARDQYRHPQQTLAFFGFNSTMTVVEIAPGGGWYSEILAPALKGSGTFYGAHYPDTGKDDYYSKSRRKLEAKLASDAVFSEMKLSNFTPKVASELAPAGTADLVLTFRNLHNWGEEGVKQVFIDSFKALKPGGFLGVVEHRMPASQSWKDNSRSGYFPAKIVLDLAASAGFKLAASSEVNANAKDTANYEKGVWTLPPVLRLGDKDKAKYLAIGESDRMTLKFVKPAK